MSINNTNSLLNLPTELFHYIFDYLDAKTILISLRHVCTRLKAVISTYARVRLDLRSISKFDFHRICRIVLPENVITLVVSNDDETPGQIELFFSRFNIHQFIRLQSLAIFLNEYDYAYNILKDIIHHPIISLRIERLDSSKYQSTELSKLLSLLMVRSIFKKLTCTRDLLFVERFDWSQKFYLKDLTLDRCTPNEFCVLLDNLPKLQTIALRSFNLDLHHECDCPSVSYPQLVSLTIQQLFLSMNKIESFLRLTPSLVHLRLEGSVDDSVFNGSRWEQLIQTNLISLNCFEFCFRSQNSRVLELYKNQFRTSFWLSEKKWPVYCIFDDPPEEILLCSTPDFITKLEYNFCGPVCISSTAQNLDNDQYKKIFFRRLAELELSDYALTLFNDDSQLIDYSQIIKLQILLSDHTEYFSKIQDKLANLLKKTTNLRSLEIGFEHGFIIDSLFLNNICSLIPHQVKHLDIELKTFDDVNFILEQLPHLSSIAIRRLPLAVLEGLRKLKTDAEYKYHRDCLHIWLGKSSTEREPIILYNE